MEYSNQFSNDDCSTIDLLWKFLSNPDSGKYYLGNIIANGLDDSVLGIHIPPFPTVSIGDLPHQTLFKDAVLGYLGLTLQQTMLLGLNTYTSGKVVCTPVSPGQTDLDLTLNFDSIDFSGQYTCDSSGLTGCAVATGAGILGGAHRSGLDLRARDGDEVPTDLELAQWFRDNPMQQSQNGQLLTGAYYAHQDTIQSVQLADNNPSNQYRIVAAQQQQQNSKTDVYNANLYYQQQQTGLNPPGAPPAIGSSDQFTGGSASYIALIKATQWMATHSNAAQGPNDTNEYDELMNAMTQFNGQIINFQNFQRVNYNGDPVPSAVVIDYMHTAPPPDDKPENLPKIPLFDFESGEIIGYRDCWPLDLDRYRKAHRAYFESREKVELDFSINGNFDDTAKPLSFELNVSFTNGNNNTLVAQVNSITVKIGTLDIALSHGPAWDKYPTLFDKFSAWLANTFFQDTIKSKIGDGLNTQSVLGSFTDALNAAIKKMGF